MPRIVTCGIPRSGSTLVWQILQALFPCEEILKTHPDIWEPDGSTAVVSIRHPHDVVASLYRVRLSRAHRTVGRRDDIAIVLRRTQFSFAALQRVIRGPHIILRYEAFYDDHSSIYEAVESAFGIQVPEETRTALSARYSVEANRARAAALRDFNEVDEAQIHGDHIGNVVPGYWRRIIPGWVLETIMAECREIAEAWGYE